MGNVEEQALYEMFGLDLGKASKGCVIILCLNWDPSMGQVAKH